MTKFGRVASDVFRVCFVNCSLSLSLSLSLSYFGFRVLGFKVYFGSFIDANKFELKLPLFFFFLHTSSRWAYAMNFHPLRGALQCLFVHLQASYKTFHQQTRELQEGYDATTVEPQHSRLCLVTSLTVLESNRCSHASNMLESNRCSHTHPPQLFMVTCPLTGYLVHYYYYNSLWICLPLLS
jgi:hypothetical protein